MSIKIERIESSMVKEISYLLANEIKDPDIHFVTVTAAKVTNDLSFAKVTKLTSPPAGSICRAFSFIREGKSLARILDKYWEKKQYYLGEWHFHPNASARPSRTDLNTMQKLAGTESIHCPEPILFIIGGNNTSWSFSCYVFANGSEIQLFQLD